MGTMADILANYDPNRLVYSNQRNQADIAHTQAATGYTQQLTTDAALKNQIVQRQLQDQSIIQRAYANTDGKPDSIFKYSVQNGISGQGGMDLQKGLIDLKKKIQDTDKEGNEIYAINLKNVGETLGDIASKTKENTPERAAAIQANVPVLQKLDPTADWSKLGTDDQSLFAHKGVSESVAALHKTQADAQKSEADAALLRAQTPGAEAASKIAQSKAEAIQSAMKNPQSLLDQVDQLGLDKTSAARTKAMVQFSIQRGDYEGAIKAIDLASTKQADIEKEIDPRVQANKVATAVAQGKAMSPIIIQRAAGEEAARNAQGALSPEAIEMAAEMYRKTGQMPQMGMGNKLARQQIMNRAAAMGPIDLATEGAAFQANKASLVGLTRQRDSVAAFENTAGKNLDLFLQQAKNAIDTGSPWINAPLRSISKGVLGSADQAAYETARQVAINEIAKVTSNPGLGGQLSDTARKEVSEFNPNSATLAQTYRVAQILKQDMANRHQSYNEQIEGIQKRIGVGGSANTAPTAAPAATHRYNPETKKIEPITQ